MAASYSVPYLTAEALIAVFQREDERDEARPLLSMFPRRQYASGKLKVRRLNRKPHRVLHTSFGGRAKPVARGSWEETYYEPTVIKLFDSLTSEDLILFAKAEAAQGSNDVGSYDKAVLSEADDRIREIGRNLRMDGAEERHALCAGALLGSVSYKIDGGPGGLLTRNISYGLTALTPPSVNWNLAGATIVSNLTSWMREFKNNNDRGLAPDTVFYNPAMWQTYFLGNTEMQTWKQQDPQLAAGFLRLGGMNEATPEGILTSRMFGLNWIPIDGSFTDADGSTGTTRWATDKLVFARMGQADARWGMSFDPLQNPDAMENIEISEPRKGDDVKSIKVTYFDNGLPIINDPQLVQTVDVVV